MDSINVFEAKKLAARPVAKTNVRPLWMVLLLAVVLPGMGHVALGRTRKGLLLLVGCLVAQGLMWPAMNFEFDHVVWLLARLATVLYLYGLVDASLLAVELTDDRAISSDSPRDIATWNLLGYGAGYWVLDEKKWAIPAILGGLGLHVFLGSKATFLAVVAELGVIGLGVHGYLMAKEALPRRRPKFGESAPREVDSTPNWLLPSLAGHGALCAIVVISSLGMTDVLRSSMEVDQSKAISVASQYRNPEYGLSLELNAPGWAFTTAAPNEFVVARHVAEKTSARFSIMPRLPGGFLKPEMYAIAALENSTSAGCGLLPELAQTGSLGEWKGFQVEAEGTCDGQRRRAVVLTAGKGWRQITLWFEWAVSHDAFARAELEYLLTNLQLEG